jgi:hypothetical protein
VGLKRSMRDMCRLNFPIEKISLGGFNRHGDGWTNVLECDALGSRGEERAGACGPTSNIEICRGRESMRAHLTDGISRALVMAH